MNMTRSIRVAICNMAVFVIPAGGGRCLYSYNGLFITLDHVVAVF